MPSRNAPDSTSPARPRQRVSTHFPPPSSSTFDREDELLREALERSAHDSHGESQLPSGLEPGAHDEEDDELAKVLELSREFAEVERISKETATAASEFVASTTTVVSSASAGANASDREETTLRDVVSSFSYNVEGLSEDQVRFICFYESI